MIIDCQDENLKQLCHQMITKTFGVAWRSELTNENRKTS